MKILFCSSEVFPYSKTGGLGDVSGSLPIEIKKLKTNIIVATPLYSCVKKYKEKMEYLGKIDIHIGDKLVPVYYHKLHENNLDYYFIENDFYFNRDSLYGHVDDGERFLFFQLAIIELISFKELKIDIIHINDWQTGLIPFLLDSKYRWRKEIKNIRTLLTIHNLEYQGSFPVEMSILFNTNFSYDYIHFDKINFLKAGIKKASLINTVSPNYRNEILTSYYGFSLDGILNERKNDFIGILNGIDYEVWNPKTDKYLYKNYSLQNYLKGKEENKQKLLKQLNLKDPNLPLVGVITRLASQKGFDLIKNIIEESINYNPFNLILIGSGNSDDENYIRYLQHKYPDKVYGYIGFNNELAHQVYAASDLFLMPSKFEPCGLSQLISMHYGTLPIVRETGGLKDTVAPYNKYFKTGTGFSFANFNAHELKDQLLTAIHLYKSNKKTFNKLIREAMKLDSSMDKMAKTYIETYKKIIREK